MLDEASWDEVARTCETAWPRAPGASRATWANLEVTRAGCGFGRQAAMAGLSLSRFVPKRLARGGADWFGLGPLPVWFQMEVPL
jgi:hypothetical protein